MVFRGVAWDGDELDRSCEDWRVESNMIGQSRLRNYESWIEDQSTPADLIQVQLLGYKTTAQL